MQDSNEENNILRAACIKRFDLFTDLLSRNCRYLVETSGLIKAIFFALVNGIINSF